MADRLLCCHSESFGATQDKLCEESFSAWEFGVLKVNHSSGFCVKQGLEIAPRIRQRTDQPHLLRLRRLRALNVMAPKTSIQVCSRFDKFRILDLEPRVAQLGNTPNSELEPSTWASVVIQFLPFGRVELLMSHSARPPGPRAGTSSQNSQSVKEIRKAV
jgi:hypothetical protein